MSEEDSRAVMREIKQKTDLLIAATYTAIKEAFDGAEGKKKTEWASTKTRKEKMNASQTTFF